MSTENETIAAQPAEPAAAAEAPVQAETTPNAKPSRAKRVLIIAIAAAAAIGSYLGISALLNAQQAPYSAPSAMEEETSYAFSSAEYGFTVQFPSKPTESTTTQSVLAFEIELMSVQWVNQDTIYSVNAANFPDEILAGQDLDVILQNSIGGAGTASGGVLSDQNFVELDGERAITGTLTYSNGVESQVLIAMKDNTQYSLLVSGSEGNWQSFVDSFEFTD